jgi:hypothetical protein
MLFVCDTFETKKQIPKCFDIVLLLSAGKSEVAAINIRKIHLGQVKRYNL